MADQDLCPPGGLGVHSEPSILDPRGGKSPPHHPGPQVEVIIHSKHLSYAQGFGLWALVRSSLIHDLINSSLILSFENPQ